jgi:Sulfotransferase domain
VVQELVYVAKYLLGRDVAGRNLTVFPDDTFIVSYPRSGNTWTRFLVANLLHPGEAVTFGNIERLIPDIHAQSKKFLKSVPRPRVIKSHEYFDPRYPRVIYIVRDPRDVVVSSYHFHRKQRQIKEGYPLESYVRDFVAGSVFRTYPSWGKNTSSWIELPRTAPPLSTGRRQVPAYSVPGRRM